MSEGNAEIVRRGYAVEYGGDDWLAIVDRYIAADCAVEDRTLPEVAADLRGPAAFRAGAAYMLDTFDEVGYVVEELRELDNQTLVRVRGSARGKGSGVHVEGTLGHIWTLRAGKVVRLDIYPTWDDALAAAGLTTG